MGGLNIGWSYSGGRTKEHSLVFWESWSRVVSELRGCVSKAQQRAVEGRTGLRFCGIGLGRGVRGGWAAGWAARPRPRLGLGERVTQVAGPSWEPEARWWRAWGYISVFRPCCFLSQSIMKLTHCGPVAAGKGGLPVQWWERSGGGMKREEEEGPWGEMLSTDGNFGLGCKGTGFLETVVRSRERDVSQSQPWAGKEQRQTAPWGYYSRWSSAPECTLSEITEYFLCSLNWLLFLFC